MHCATLPHFPFKIRNARVTCIRRVFLHCCYFMPSTFNKRLVVFCRSKISPSFADDGKTSLRLTSEFSGRQFSHKHFVNFLKRSTHKLRKGEICPNQSNNTYSAVDEAELRLQIGITSIDKIWYSKCNHEGREILKRPADNCGLIAESKSWYLGACERGPLKKKEKVSCYSSSGIL